MTTLSIDQGVFGNHPEGKAAFLSYLHDLKLPLDVRLRLIAIKEECPARSVDKRTRGNMIVELDSRKCGAVRVLESRSVEHVFALTLELNPNVLCYFVQVPCKAVSRVSENGRKLTNSLTLDFLVCYRDRIEFVECKLRTGFEKLAREKPHEWLQIEGRVRRPAMESWTRELGCHYLNWSPCEPIGIYRQNLEILYALAHPLTSDETARIQRAATVVNRSPCTLAKLCSQVEGLSSRDVMRGIATCVLFGPLQSCQLENAEDFLIYADASRAKALDEARLVSSTDQLRSVLVDDPVLLASATDYKGGLRRLARVERILAGLERCTERYKALVAAVEEGKQKGEDLLAICLTNFSKSGRRLGQLSTRQLAVRQHVIEKYWLTGRKTVVRELHIKLLRICERIKEPPISYELLRLTVMKLAPETTDLQTGGVRKYNQRRGASDPRDRTLSAGASGITWHIDSSKFDHRSAPDIYDKLLFLPPLLYVACDSREETPVGHALVFGRSRTDALAIVMRDSVWRTGSLAHNCILDRGAENRSKWMRGFAKGKLSLHFSGPANPRSNSLAENTINRVNSQVAHRLVGSTDPDKAGRSVDSKFKSYRTAYMQFSQICEEVESYLYGDLPNIPTQDGGTPRERRQLSLASYGALGIPQPFDDNFLIATSVPVKKFQVIHNKGIVLAEGTYSSTDLLMGALVEVPTQVRMDCVDPTKIYIKYKTHWVTAFHQRVQIFASRTPLARLFHLLYTSELRPENRDQKLAVGVGRQARLENAMAAAPATEHLHSATNGAEHVPNQPEAVAFDEELMTFEVEGMA